MERYSQKIKQISPDHEPFLQPDVGAHLEQKEEKGKLCQKVVVASVRITKQNRNGIPVR